ncbi:MAG: ATP-binding protein, partial [Kiritimatiellaeota bacterium]|nr:ATP-binding protein [Kiritimatiellota bacterium]
MGLAKVYSGGVAGVEAFEVEIEASARMGDPAMYVVGLPDAAVRESKDRVWTAIGNSHLFFNPCHMTVNLAPADVRKEGASFDLPIALSILLATDALKPNANPGAYMALGELALSGAVRRVRGVLPIAIMARKRGFKGLLVPAENAAEAAVVDGLDVHAIANLREAVDFLEGKIEIPPTKVDLASLFDTQLHCADDFSEVKGQALARRALEVAVSGGHGVLMIGSPGCGKSLMARRIPSILPPMTLEEALETTQIHSVAGALSPRQSLLTQRPF